MRMVRWFDWPYTGANYYRLAGIPSAARCRSSVFRCRRSPFGRDSGAVCREPRLMEEREPSAGSRGRWRNGSRLSGVAAPMEGRWPSVASRRQRVRSFGSPRSARSVERISAVRLLGVGASLAFAARRRRGEHAPLGMRRSRLFTSAHLYVRRQAAAGGCGGG